MIFHSILSGVLNGIGFWYCLPKTLTPLYNSSAAAVALFVFSWITVIVAQLPLTMGGTLPEVATFTFSNNYELVSLSRTFHIFIFYSFHIVEM